MVCFCAGAAVAAQMAQSLRGCCSRHPYAAWVAQAVSSLHREETSSPIADPRPVEASRRSGIADRMSRLRFSFEEGGRASQVEFADGGPVGIDRAPWAVGQRPGTRQFRPSPPPASDCRHPGGRIFGLTAVGPENLPRFFACQSLFPLVSALLRHPMPCIQNYVGHVTRLHGFSVPPTRSCMVLPCQCPTV